MFSSPSFLPSLRSYNGASHHFVISWLMLSTLFLADCTRFSRSWTISLVFSMYSHAPLSSKQRWLTNIFKKMPEFFFFELRVPAFLRYLQMTKWRQNGAKGKLNAWQTDRRYFDGKSLPATYTLALSKKVTSVTRNSRNSKDNSSLICSFPPPPSHPLPPIFLSFSAPFYGYFKPINSQQKEKKSKQVFEVTPGNLTRKLPHREGRTLTSSAGVSWLWSFHSQKWLK